MRFDSKAFNPQAFGAYVENISDPKKKELARSGAVGTNENAKQALSCQTGSLYARIPYFGRISGSTSQNNDGGTNIQSTNTTTYEQGFVTASRMDSWTERSFSKNITAGADFMDNVGRQIADYKLEVKQDMLLAILQGIFSMPVEGGSAKAQAANQFITRHTYNITGAANDEDKMVGADTLNMAISKACGDNKNAFKLVIMHSAVSTHLENLRLVEYLRYSDENGIQRDLPLASWNGRTVLVDDGMPTEEIVSVAPVYGMKVTAAAAVGDKLRINGKVYTFVANDADDTGDLIKIGAAGTAAQQAANIAEKVSVEGYTVTSSSAKVVFTAAQGTNPDQPVVSAEKSQDGTLEIASTVDTEPVFVTNYTTYVLGEGAVILDEIGDSVPYEMNRDPKTNGGQDTLYVRDRYICGVDGISFEKPYNITASASNDDLRNGSNWEIINDGATWIDHKSIPIARIISRG